MNGGDSGGLAWFNESWKEGGCSWGQGDIVGEGSEKVIIVEN